MQETACWRGRAGEGVEKRAFRERKGKQERVYRRAIAKESVQERGRVREAERERTWNRASKREHARERGRAREGVEKRGAGEAVLHSLSLSRTLLTAKSARVSPVWCT